MDLFSLYASESASKQEEEYSIKEFFDNCKKDNMLYASPAERMLAAIGEPEIINTADDPKMSRIFQNRTIRRYKAFKNFYGMEDTIERIVGFFRHAAQGLEEKKQILYFLGPVGGGKSSLAERMKELMEENPIYVLKAGDEISPVFEHPLGLFAHSPDQVNFISEEYGIPDRYMTNLIPSPWAVKRLKEMGGDVSGFKVVKLWPSKLTQVGITKTEPGDENNQDISSLVGKVDIRKLEYYSQHDTDAYGYNGGLCRANQGVMEFVEMFKAPISVLHPLLTATQESNYESTEPGLGNIPFNGIVMAHSNETEWQAFKNNKANEAFIDRVYVVKVPYALRRDEEVKIYEKLLENSSLRSAPCAPLTLSLLADFATLSRIKKHANSNVVSKMKVYNGDNMKDKDPKAKSLQEYKDEAGVDEGMGGISTRFGFKILSQTFNFDPDEVAADPVHLMYVLEKLIKEEQYADDREREYLDIIKDYMTDTYKEFIGNEIQRAYLESYSEYGQSVFDRYVEYADAWVQDIEHKDPDTGTMYDRQTLNAELEKIEKPAGIANPKDFRGEVVNFVLRARAKHDGNNPLWTSYAKLREVIEKKLFANTEDLIPVISFTPKSNANDVEKHEAFIERMAERGYSTKQTQRLAEWYMRVRKSA